MGTININYILKNQMRRVQIISIFFVILIVYLSSCTSIIKKSGDGNSPSDLFLPVYTYDGKQLRCGFIDINGRIVIKLQYQWVTEFREGLCLVYKDNKAGFIDEKGNIIGPLMYDRAENFHEGLAVVSINGKWGYINTKGEIAIEPQYSYADSFSEGMARVTINNNCQSVYIDKNGKIIFDLCERYGLKNWKNYKKYAISASNGFSEGLLAVYNENDDYGFVDRNGDIVIEPRFDYAYGFLDGLAKVILKDPRRDAYIDRTGKVVVELGPDMHISMFYEGLAVVYYGKTSYGFINKQGEWAIRMECGWLGNFSEGLAAINTRNLWFYIDKTGNKGFSVNIPGIVYAGTFHNSLAVIKVKNKYGCIDRQGNIVLKPEYDNLSNTKYPVLQFTKGDTFGYMNLKGKVIWSTDTNPGKYIFK